MIRLENKTRVPASVAASGPPLRKIPKTLQPVDLNSWYPDNKKDHKDALDPLPQPGTLRQSLNMSGPLRHMTGHG